MAIHVITSKIPDIKIIEPAVFVDERGFFSESYNEKDFGATIGPVHFVQDNHSMSQKGVLRGLHYQLAPHAQAKLVRCVRGSIFDVAVDIRRSSPTFGQWVAEELSETNQRQMWIPEGFAHGFIALTDEAHVIYKTTGYWVKDAEACIAWDDPMLAIAWPGEIQPILSARDAVAPLFKDAKLFD